MHFLPDGGACPEQSRRVPCEVCKGRRYNRETLEVRFRGRNIADVLAMTVEEAEEFFSAIPKIHRKMATLLDVGLGYIKLGQPATTLSGGEAQRVKSKRSGNPGSSGLVEELSKRSTGTALAIGSRPDQP